MTTPVTVSDRLGLENTLDRTLLIAEENVAQGVVRASGSAVEMCDVITDSADAAKSGFVNIVTCLLAKAFEPAVDCRFHREARDGMPHPPSGADNYFSGRTISESLVAGWLRHRDFVFANSGWQTRTFERPRPYTLDYPENIRPRQFKRAFLGLLDLVQEQQEDATAVLDYLFQLQLRRRDAQDITISTPNINDIGRIVQFLTDHFGGDYKTKGASRLPVLALYAVYDILICELSRYDGCTLLPLQSHSSADASSGAIGDIEVLDDSKGKLIEGLEVKHEVPLGVDLVARVYEKIRDTQVGRYYILTTHSSCTPDSTVSSEIERIQRLHGCQIIANGLVPTLRYYLRLIKRPSDFFPRYGDLLAKDEALAYEHRQAWNLILGSG